MSPSKEISRLDTPLVTLHPFSSHGKQFEQSLRWLRAENSTEDTDGLVIEELGDGFDMAYDADIEIRQPDEYDEPDSDDETSVSLLAILPLNEANLAEHFRRLNCDPSQSEFNDFRAGEGLLARPKSISRKRNRRPSLGSLSDEQSGMLMDHTPRRKRQARQVELPAHRSSSLDNFNASLSPPDYSPVTTRSLQHTSTPVDYMQARNGSKRNIDNNDSMDIDGA